MLFLFLFNVMYYPIFLEKVGRDMVLTYGTVEGINLQVARGLGIGYFGIDDDLSKIPKLIGDWSIKTVPDAYRHGVGLIVAVPTNRRTRMIYKKGRMVWLEGLGFSVERALQYYRISARAKRKWDHRVATFVNNNFNLDPFVIADIISSKRPRQACLDNGIYTTMHHGQVVDALLLLEELQKL